MLGTMQGLGVLLAVALVVGGCGSQASPQGVDLGSPEVPAPSMLATGCPPRMDAVRYAEGDLPSGAVSVRLCPGRPIIAYDGTIYDPGIQPPGDLLTTRVDELIAAANGLTGPAAGLACPADGGPRLNYWFSYPDGDARAVTFELFGCDLLYVGEHEARVDGDRVARAFAEALLEQRAAGTPPGAGQAPTCEGIWSVGSTALPVIPTDLQVASLCVGNRADRLRPASVPTSLVEQLEEELESNGPATTPCRAADRTVMHVLALNTWGDRIRLSIDQCGVIHLGRSAGWPRDSETSIALSEDLLTRLDALPLGPPVRVDPYLTKVSPPATPG